jgi:hypothetical protein
MEIQYIEIGGIKHPMAGTLNAMLQINEAVGIQKLSDLATFDELKSLRLFRACAFYQIAAGYRLQNQPNYFKDEEHLGDLIENFNQLKPCFELWQTSQLGFFGQPQTTGQTTPRQTKAKTPRQTKG